MSARGDRYIKNKLFYEGKWKTLLINFEEFEPASILCLYMNSRHWTFIFHGFFFLPYAFSNHLIVKKKPHLHWVTENYILIRYFVN